MLNARCRWSCWKHFLRRVCHGVMNGFYVTPYVVGRNGVWIIRKLFIDPGEGTKAICRSIEFCSLLRKSVVGLQLCFVPSWTETTWKKNAGCLPGSWPYPITESPRDLRVCRPQLIFLGRVSCGNILQETDKLRHICFWDTGVSNHSVIDGSGLHPRTESSMRFYSKVLR